MISVVIPLYNKEKQIAKTLKTVLDQTFQDFEIVIVNDGSTDNSVAEVEKFSDPRIRLIHQKNAGVSAARNKGIAEAKGNFIALLDADDEWKPDYLETQMHLATKYPECDVFATNYVFKDNEGKITPAVIRNLPFKEEDGILTNYFKVASTSHPPLCSSAVMAHKSVFETIGGFPLGIKSGEDLLTWARMSARYKIAYLRYHKACCSVEGYKISEKPKRIPQYKDTVHQELVMLQRYYNPPFIKAYISHWHKMRSMVYMRLGMRKESIGEAIKGLKYSKLNYKLYIYIVLNLLPKTLQPF